MTKYYISQSNVDEAVEYFKNLTIKNDHMLMMFLITKHLGVTLRKPVTIAVGKMDRVQKEDMLNTLWLLGGLFDNSEKTVDSSILFPTNFSNEEIKKLDIYQNGTPFKDLAGRPRDTIKQKNETVELFNYNGDTVSLRRNFKDLIASEYLNGNKISLKHLSSWILRFVGLDFENTPHEIEFTRVIRKHIMTFIKITKTDFLWLFDDDIINNSFSFSEQPTSGAHIRSLFTFSGAAQPTTIQALSGAETSIITQNQVTPDDVKKYLQLIGENPDKESIENTLIMKKQIVLTGVPGVGKSRILNDLKAGFELKEMIQFHANYSYEDFIGGETLSAGDIQTKKGIFLNFIEKTQKKEHIDKNHLFIIDELNRGNIAQIFGETILTLDRGYSVKLAKTIEGIDTFSIPDNVYIAASMNTSDRNIAFLDLAIRRRFAFIDLVPNYEVLSAITEYHDYDLGNVLKQINQGIINTLAKEELLLGHSYFISEHVKQIDKYIWTDETMHLQFNFVILPTLKEYTFSNTNALTTILGNELSTGILNLDDFIDAFEDQFGV